MVLKRMRQFRFIAFFTLGILAKEMPLHAIQYTSSETHTPVLIDTDMASDDWSAILYVLNHKNTVVKAITVPGTGEAHCDLISGNTMGAINALNLIELTIKKDANIPVACGQSMPTQGQHVFPDSWRVDSDTIFGMTLPQSHNTPSHDDAVTLITSILKQSEEKVKILAIGPLTNIALALQTTPEIAEYIESITIMGGAVRVPGNLYVGGPSFADNTFAEWNIFIDPHAAQIVFESGVPIQLVPLDGTRFAPITFDFLERFETQTHTPASKFLFDVLSKQTDLIRAGRNKYFWDTLAAAVITNPSLCEFEILPLRVVEQEGPESGRTYIDPLLGRPISVCTKANGSEFEELFLQTINSL